MVNKTIPVTEFQRNAPIAVTPFVLMEYGVYHIFYFLVLVFPFAMLEVIIERATRHLLEL